MIHGSHQWQVVAAYADRPVRWRCTMCQAIRSQKEDDDGCPSSVVGDKVEEKVNHPRHYNEHPSGIECITVVEHMTFNLGNAVKYLWRAGLKPDTTAVEDLKKAVWYLQREIGRLEKRTGKP